MTRWLLIASLLLPIAARAQPQIVVQTRITPAKVMVGQQAQLLVDVYYLNTMLHPPLVTVPDIDGAQLFRFSSQGVNTSTTINGSSYTGQEFEFDIYPRRSGSFTIPPAQITLQDANGNPAGTQTGTAAILIAQIPPGFSAASPIVASPNVTMVEHFHTSTAHPAVGDSVTRTITRRADTVPGLSFTDFPLPKILGVQIYADPPDIEDITDRGDVTGKRTDKVTFIFETPGKISIPPVSETWWNTDLGHAETIQTQGFTTIILPGNSVEIETFLRPAYAVILAALLATCGAAYIWHRHHDPAAPRHPTKRSAVRRLRAACARTDAQAAYKALIIWRAFQPPTLLDSPLAASIATLEHAVFGNTGWSPENARALARNLRRKHRSPRRKAKSQLPVLNPGQGD